MSSTLKFSELDFENDYDESKDSDYAPGDRVDSLYSRVDEALALLESGKRSLLLEDVSTACNDLAMSCELLAEEHGEQSEKCAEAYHQYGRALLAWSRMEGEVFEHAMSGFDLGESEEPKVEVEDTDSLALDERKEIEDGVSEALDENYDTHTAIADCHYNEASDSEEESSDEDSEDAEDSETSEDESEQEDVEETEIFEPTNLELSWEMLELARLGFTKTGDKEQLAEVYLDLGQVCMENQDYDLAVMDFGESLKLKKVLLPTDSRSLASVFYHLGMALAYSGKMSEAEVNLNSAITTLEARSKNISKMEVSEYVMVEKAELEACIQEIGEIVVDHKDMQKQISMGEALALLDSGKRSLLLEDVSTACYDLDMACELMAEEYGEQSEKCAEAYHQYGRALLAWSRMEGKVFEHAMSGFDLGESEELEVEDTDSLALDERKEIEDGVSEALDENYDTHSAIADCHYNEASDEEEQSSDEDSEDTEDSETSEDESEQEEDVEESVKAVEESVKALDLELSWEMLELARLGFTKTGDKEQLAEVYLDLGQVAMEVLVLCRSLASLFYHLGMALAYSGKMSEAEVNLNSAIATLEARSKNIAKMEVSEYVTVEKAELEACVQEIGKIIVDLKDMYKQISMGTVGAKLATRIGVNSEAIMSAKQAGSATVGTA